MKLGKLCDAAGLICPKHSRAVEITSVETDSGKVGKGSLFLALRGTRTDGNLYIPQALSNGAAGIVSESETPLSGDAVFLRTDSVRRAAASLYHAWYGRPVEGLRCIGVTGTNGKTSVTRMLCAILEADARTVGLIGTVGCELGGKPIPDFPVSGMTTPDPKDLYRLLSEIRQGGAEFAVMEASSHALVLEKLAPIRFSVSAFTNLSPEHLDFHKTMSAYADAKAKLFEQSDCAVLSVDSEYSDVMRKHAAGRVVTVSAEGKDADYRATHIRLRADAGCTYLLTSADLELPIECPVPGSFSVMNSMQAAVCALESGISPNTVRRALAKFSGVPGRMERVPLGVQADFTVFLDYAHTPDALERLLVSVRQFRKEGQRIVLLFGCGGDRDRTKRPVMGGIASRLADRVILTSDNSRSEEPDDILKEILGGVTEPSRVTVIPDRRAAITEAILTAQTGDLILLVGKGHETYEITKKGKLPFSEKEIVRSAFAARTQSEQQKEDEP